MKFCVHRFAGWWPCRPSTSPWTTAGTISSSYQSLTTRRLTLRRRVWTFLVSITEAQARTSTSAKWSTTLETKRSNSSSASPGCANHEWRNQTKWWSNDAIGRIIHILNIVMFSCRNRNYFLVEFITGQYYSLCVCQHELSILGWVSVEENSAFRVTFVRYSFKQASLLLCRN